MTKWMDNIRKWTEAPKKWERNVEKWMGEDTFPLLNQIRPSWDMVYKGYPKNETGDNDLDADSVFKSILEDDYNRLIFANACATRVSLGLLNGGVNVKKDFLIQKGRFKGKGFIASALNLKKWLETDNVWGNPDEKILGPTNLIEAQKIIGKRNGVYIIIGGFGASASGHSTLWLGAKQNVIGNHNYISLGGDIYFWELE